MPDSVDTIAAQATPPGRGGVGIIRVSGPACRRIAVAVLGALPPPRHATYLAFRDAAGEPLDSGLALFFPSPGSFTGEDVLELHGHGGPVVLDLLLQRVLALGARAARPGEFSERAFLNDKIDLAQAEAIADLIDAASAHAARAAVRSLQGEFSQRIHALVAQLTELRVYVEAALDFAEEEGIDFLADRAVGERLAHLLGALDAVLDRARQGQLLREGMSVVIAGRPNAGKSSLLNALAGRDAAIVTDVPGTTRDVLREHIVIDGLPLHIIDTAGLRDSSDSVEKEGIRRAWHEIEQADRLLLLIDDTLGESDAERDWLARLPPALPVTRVYNKIDLSLRAPGLGGDADAVWVAVSAKTGNGLDELRRHLKEAVGFSNTTEGTFTARRRHLDALHRARDLLDSGARALEAHHAGELLAEDLRLAQQALGEITGEFTADDLLGRIFASFCIGK